MKMNGTNCFPTCSSTSPELQGRKSKTILTQNFNHEINVRCSDLFSHHSSYYDEPDSDPEETQRILDSLLAQAGDSSALTTAPSPQTTYRMNTIHHPDTLTNGTSTRSAKYSIGGWSTADSGMHSRDSLLDEIGSQNSLGGSRSSVLSSSPLPERRSRGDHLSRGEFDAVSRATLLDSKLRSTSRGRLERSKSPCRGHSVKNIISFFETSNSSPTHSHSRESSSSSTNGRIKRDDSSRLQSNSSLNTVVHNSHHRISGSTPPTQNSEKDHHLTKVASGYSQHTPYTTKSTNQTSQSTTVNQSHNNNTHNGAAINPPAQTHSESNTTNNHTVNGSHTKSAELDDIKLDLSGGGVSVPGVSGSDVSGSGNNVVKDEVDRAIIERDDVFQSNVQDSPSKKGGDWFLQITQKAEDKLLALGKLAQNDLDNQELTEEVSGQLRAAIGKSHLLVHKKFKQFRGLCNKNLTQNEEEPFPTTSQDLAGFWDMVNLQVEGVCEDFNDIQKLRENNWIKIQQSENELIDSIVTTPRNKTSNPVFLRSDSNSDKSSPLSDRSSRKKTTTKPTPSRTPAASRDEARKRLMAAKRAMKERRNSQTEDVIYVK